MPRFSGRNLSCVRGERRVFGGLVFDLGPGEALVLGGPNGSGKSSLLRLMAGLLRPVDGVIAWDGAPIGGEPEEHRRRLHYVGHADAVKPVLGVGENLAFWAAMGTGRWPEPETVDSALAALGMDHLGDLAGRFLSAGQRRRVNLARIVASAATLWLLDEPTTALDAGATESLRRTIAHHRNGGGMVVVATHAEMGLEDPRTLDLAQFTASPAGAGS